MVLNANLSRLYCMAGGFHVSTDTFVQDLFRAL